MKSRKWLALVVALILVLAMMTACGGGGSSSSEGSKAFTLQVVDDQGETAEYTGTTDAEYLSDLMDEVAEGGEFSYEGTDSDMGLYITTVNGVTADYEKDGAYWSIMVNGEYGQYGADAQPVADGDEFQLVYTKM